MAVIENRELRRMEFKLTVEDDWPPVSVESLWVVDSGERRFTIDNAPFFVTGIAVGDLVSGEERSDDLLQFSGKIEGGGHSTIQVIVVNEVFSPSLIRSYGA